VPSGSGPTALPGVRARVVAFVAILTAGLCGLLIGSSLTRFACRGDCDLLIGIVGLIAAVAAAGGVATVSVLVLRAMGEWQVRRRLE